MASAGHKPHIERLFALVRARLDPEHHAGPHIQPLDVRGCRGCEALDALASLEEQLETAREERDLFYERLEVLREDVRVAIEDILLLDSPEGDSPRNIAANLRRAVGSNPASRQEEA